MKLKALALFAGMAALSSTLMFCGGEPGAGYDEPVASQQQDLIYCSQLYSDPDVTVVPPASGWKGTTFWTTSLSTTNNYSHAGNDCDNTWVVKFSPFAYYSTTLNDCDNNKAIVTAFSWSTSTSYADCTSRHLRSEMDAYSGYYFDCQGVWNLFTGTCSLSCTSGGGSVTPLSDRSVRYDYSVTTYPFFSVAVSAWKYSSPLYLWSKASVGVTCE